MNYRYPENSVLRKSLHDWYLGPKGLKLRDLEATYLAHAIDVSYRQTVLQIGVLGWEDLFADMRCFQNYFVVDQSYFDDVSAKKVKGKFDELPFASESADLVIMPHSLEFETDQHQAIREIERVLKPEGKLLLLGFYPWSISRLYYGVPGKQKLLPWSGSFISRFRVHDWLSLLNFEVELSTSFFFNSSRVVRHLFGIGLSDFFAVGYALTATKRRFNIIPLKPALVARPRFSAIEVAETTYHNQCQ